LPREFDLEWQGHKQTLRFGDPRLSPRAPRKKPGPRLQERDVRILNWIGRHGVVTHEQVTVRFFASDDHPGTWAAYRRLRALERVGLIRRDRAYSYPADIFRVTRDGAEAGRCGVGPAPLRPKVLATLDHDLSVVDLMDHLLATTPGATLTTERELWADWYRNLRSGARLPRLPRMPDGALTQPDGRMIAVELDLTSKSTRRIEEIINAYLASPYRLVWWYVTSETIATRYRSVVAAEKVDDVFDVRVWNRS